LAFYPRKSAQCGRDFGGSSLFTLQLDEQTLRKLIKPGAALVLPVIIAYTIFSYRVFAGKAKPLSYSH
jgi:hypothetical protein